MYPEIDVTEDLKEFITSKKTRCRTIEYSLNFQEMKLCLDEFLKKNNFSSMEIRTIYHLMNIFYFTGHDLNDNDSP